MSDRFATVEVLARRVEQLAAGDPDATRVVYAIVIALLVIGLLLVLLATWMIRRTKADLELLGPLERMGDSKWRKRDEADRRAMLDEVRPAGATPPEWPDSQPDPVGTVLPPPVVPPVHDAPAAVEPEIVETDAVEPESVESDAVGPDAVEPESVGPDAVGPDAVEPESVGPDAVEPDPVETEFIRPDAIETEFIQPDAVEPDTLEPDPVEADPEPLAVTADVTDHTTPER